MGPLSLISSGSMFSGAKRLAAPFSGLFGGQGSEASGLRLTSVTIADDGETWTFLFSAAVTSDGTGFSGGAVALTYSSGSGTNSLVFTGDTIVGEGDSVTADYDSGVGNVTDGSNTLPSLSGIVVINESEVDLIDPELSSATVGINGLSWTLIFSESVTTDGTGFSGDGSTTGAVALTYVSGSGTNTLLFTGNATIIQGETVTLDYTPGNVADASSNALAAISDSTVTNDSEATEPPAGPELDRSFVRNDGNSLQSQFNNTVLHVSEPTVTASGGAVTATYSSGSGTANLNYTLSRQIDPTEEVTVDYGSGAVTSGGTGNAAVADFDCIHRLNVAHGTAPDTSTQHEGMPSSFRNGGIRSGGSVDFSTLGATAADYVLIESGDTVTLDTTGLAAKGILVAGVLKASRAATSAISCTTCIVLSGGELDLGKVGDEIPSTFTHTWTVRNEALPSQELDPFQFSNGIVVLGGGKFYAHGAVKTCRARDLRTAALASATDTAITMEAAPSGWEAGDEVVLLATAATASKVDIYSPSGYSAGRDPEVRIIDSVVGTTVNVTVGLTDDHPPALDKDDANPWYPHLANLTRNVKIRSEVQFGSGTVGHILATGRADLRLRYVEHTDLGRTRGGKQGLDDTVYDEATGVLTSYGTNQRGRYSGHGHHLFGPATDIDVQTLTFGGTPDGGTFKLVYIDDDGVKSTTGDIPWDATGATLASNIQAALDALHGASAITVTGTGPFTLTSAGTVRQAVGVLNSLTGTEPTINPGYQFEHEGCTFRRSGRWAVAIHGSSYGLFKGNLIYDATAAGLSFENGTEWFNTVHDNIITYIHNEGVDEDFGPCITANAIWGQNQTQDIQHNVLACCWQKSDSAQDINLGLQEPYRAHGIHWDLIRDGDLAPATAKKPRGRGSDVMHGTEGTDYDTVGLGLKAISHDNNEFYSIFACISFDHTQDTTGGIEHLTDGNRAWHIFNGLFFIYGNGDTAGGTVGSAHLHTNFEVRDFVQNANSNNAHGGAIIYRNGTMTRSSQAPSYGGAPTPFGGVNRGGAPTRSVLFFDNCTIHCESPFYFSVPSHDGPNLTGGPPDTYMPGVVIVVKDCTITQPVGATNDPFELKDLAFEGAVQCRDPMSIHQWWIDNLNGDGRLLQAYRAGQLPSATANGPALSDGYACPVDGLTNQQCFDTYGRASSGELSPTAGTTTLSGVDAILKEDTTALAVTGVESTATRTTVTFNRRVSDTEILYCLADAFNSFAGFTLNGGAAIGLIYFSGEFETEVVFIHSRHLSDAETLTLDYSAVTGTVGIWPIRDLKALATFSGTSVTNSSALTGGDPSPFTSGAVLHAALDDDNVWSDDGPNAITITETGTVTVVDGAASFPGDATAKLVANDAALDALIGSGVFSVCVQAQLTTGTTGQTVLHKQGAFIGASGNQFDKYTFVIHWDAPNTWYFRIRLADGTAAAASLIDNSGTVAGNLRSLAMTYDGTTIRCWVDGVEGTSASLPSGVGAGDGAAGDLVIGSYGDLFGGGNTQPMTGLVKNLRLFDYVLSEDEILMQYANGTPPTWPYPDLPAAGGAVHLIGSNRNVISGAPISA